MIYSMKSKVILSMMVLALLAALPASASTWRSSTGNVFRFQGNGSYTVMRPNGSTNWGRWWWVQHQAVFDYKENGSGQINRVYLQPVGAVCQSWRGTFQWSQISSRGGEDEKDDTGWFAPAGTPEGLDKR